MKASRLIFAILGAASVLSFGYFWLYATPFVVSVRVETGGEYTARNLGTMFEASGGDTFCRAGFQNAAQTRGKVSQKHIEFSCEAENAVGSNIEIFDAGRPGKDSYRSEVRSLKDQVVDVAALALFTKGQWEPYSFEQVERAVDQSKMYVQTFQMVQGELLTFPHGVGKVLYGERTVLDYGYGHSLRNGIYYDGRIFVSDFDSESKHAWLTICDWKPSDIACSHIRKLDWPYWKDVYGMIGWQGDLYLSTGTDVSGKGSGIWRLTPQTGELLQLTPGSDSFSGEFYAMMVVNDKLIAGHYPSGYLAVIERSGAVKFLEVPRALSDSFGQENGQTSYREAQSLNLYAGRIWVGMYPWGYLWEGDPALEHWKRHRLFTWPEVDASQPTPFHAVLNARYLSMSVEERAEKGSWALPSFWGQRIHSVALSGDENAILYGLGNMPGLPYDPLRDSSFGSVVDFDEYGSVKGLRAENTILKYVPWPDDGALELVFTVRPNEMSLTIDGDEVERIPARLSKFDIAQMKLTSVGSGVFGNSEYKVEATSR